jgi:hypothetical protein
MSAAAITYPECGRAGPGRGQVRQWRLRCHPLVRLQGEEGREDRHGQRPGPLLISVPPQPREMQPYLVHGAVVGDKTKEPSSASCDGAERRRPRLQQRRFTLTSWRGRRSCRAAEPGKVISPGLDDSDASAFKRRAAGALQSSVLRRSFTSLGHATRPGGGALRRGWCRRRGQGTPRSRRAAGRTPSTPPRQAGT